MVASPRDQVWDHCHFISTCFQCWCLTDPQTLNWLHYYTVNEPVTVACWDCNDKNWFSTHGKTSDLPNFAVWHTSSLQERTLLFGLTVRLQFCTTCNKAGAIKVVCFLKIIIIKIHPLISTLKTAHILHALISSHTLTILAASSPKTH